jgi:hypothetical protein
MPGELSTPEGGMAIETQPGGPDEYRELEEEAEAPSRLATARALQFQPGRGADDLRMWERGRDEAIAALEAGASPAQVRAQAPPQCQCRHCWSKGRDAVLKVIEG